MSLGHVAEAPDQRRKQRITGCHCSGECTCAARDHAVSRGHPGVSALTHLQRTAGNHAVQRLVGAGPTIARQGADQRTPVFTSADQQRAEQIATRVYDALDYVDDEDACISALYGHNERMRQAIRWAFSEKYDESLAGYLDDDLSGDELVRAHALLSHESYHGLETAMGLCLLPLGTRDEELWRIMNSLSLDGRKRLEREYDMTFGRAGEGVRYSHHIGEGSLKEDLKEDLSGWHEDKAIAMLDHDLTSAEKLYLDSRGIAGTHEDELVQRLQGEWDKGLSNFRAFEADWDRLVRPGQHWENSGESLYEAMDEELSGEDWEFVQVIIDRAHKGIAAGLDRAATLTPEQQEQAESLELEVHAETLRSAAGGGGTNEDQVYRAVEKIQQIWARRISRAEQAGDVAKKQAYERSWEEWKQWASKIVRSEMDPDWGDRERALLLLEGSLTAADELYLGKLALDNDKVLAAADKAWGQGKIEEILTLSRTERRGSAGNVVRPRYSPEFAIPVSSGLPWRRLNALLGGGNDVTRGVTRLKLELEEGDDDSDLERAYNFLAGPNVRAELMAEVVESFGRGYLGSQTGETGRQKFIAYIGNRYEKSNAFWNFLDKLEPTTDLRQKLERARGRWAANVDFGDAVVDVITNPFTQEEALLTAAESLARLDYIVRSQNATSPEIEAMLAITGKTNLEALAEYEYNQFVSRLEEVRALKRAFTEALAMVVEIVIDLAITAMTAGAAGGMLLASLASTIAGMMVREGMLGRYYDVQSMAGLQQLTLSVASVGFAGAGARAFKNLNPEQLAQIGKAQLFMREVGAEAVQNAGTSVTNAMFDQKLPSAESIAAHMISVAGRGAGATAKARIARGITEDMPNVQRLRLQVIGNVTQQVVGGVGDEVGELARTGGGQLSAAEIAMRFGRNAGGAMLRGVGSGVGEHGSERVAAARATRRQAGVAEPEGEPEPRRDLGAEGEGEETGAPRPTTALEQARVADELARIGPVNPETRTMLEGNEALRRRFVQNPRATSILKLCKSKCLPEEATDAQVAQLETILTAMEAAGISARDEVHQAALRQYFYEHRANLSAAIDNLDKAFHMGLHRRQIDAMAEQGVGVTTGGPPTAAVTAAVDRLTAGTATDDDLRTLLARAVADFRSYHAVVHRGTRPDAPAAFTAGALKDRCGPGRDLTAESLASLTVGSPVPIFIHRFQAEDFGLTRADLDSAQHGFAVVVFPNGKRFLVDPTFGQFIASSGEGSVGGYRTRETGQLRKGGRGPQGLKLARDLMRDGFVELDPPKAHDYGWGLGGASSDAAVQAFASALMEGERAHVIELIRNGRVSRMGPVEPEIRPAAPEPGEEFSFAGAIDDKLRSGDPAPGSPSYLELEALRMRLFAVAAITKYIAIEEPEEPAP